MLSLRKSRNGSILDWFLVPVILFVSAITLLVCFMLLNKVNDTGIFAEDVEAQADFEHARGTLMNMDNMMIFMIVGLSLFVVISSAMVWNHPAFFFIMIILLAIAIGLSAWISNTYSSISTSDTFNTTSASYPKLNFLMDMLPFYISILGVLSGIVMFCGYIYAR